MGSIFKTETDPSIVPSVDRVEAGSVNLTPAQWPKTTVPSSVDPPAIAADIVKSINSSLAAGDAKTIADLFAEDGYLRDHLSLGWDFRTLTGRNEVASFLAKGISWKSFSIDDSTAFLAPKIGALDGTGNVHGIVFFADFETNVGRGRGVFRLIEKNGQWKVWTLYTRLEELIGHEEGINERRLRDHGRSGKNWFENRVDEVNFENCEPTVLILGAGQGGLTVAARLKMLGVNTLLVDQADSIGASWRNRYHHLVLHDPVWYDHMPYVNFPASWPVFAPKDKLADFFESYAKLLDLNAWCNSSLESTSWDNAKRQWTVTVKRGLPNGSTEMRTLHPKHIIQATGLTGKQSYPATLKGLNDFKGDLLIHSAQFKGVDPSKKGKKVVIVGSCTSGHDIAKAYYENGADVTMVQRSTTHIVSNEGITEIALGGLYEEGGPPVDDADLLLHSMPGAVLKSLSIELCKKQAKMDEKLLADLEKVGFQLDSGPHGGGLFIKYMQRGGGYYIDVGASRLIADGKIKLKVGQSVEQVLEHGVKFADGSTLDADEIIFATGYKNLRTVTREIFGDGVADTMEDVWGFNPEGEIRGVWRNSGHPGFWVMGGNLAFCRYYSKNLALQIKAIEVGLYKS
jgi:hypothetical protein